MTIDFSTFIAAIAPAVGALAWIFALKGRVVVLETENKTMRTEIDKVSAKHDALDSKIVERLSAIETAMARMEGYLKAKIEEA